MKISGLVPTLDACASVVKSDTLVGPDLKNALRRAFSDLIEDHKRNPDWHPRSNDMVQNLIHPSLYPLVYGRTRVLRDEVVGVDDAISKWAGKGDVIAKPTSGEPDGSNSPQGGGYVPKSRWSTNYQWLPSNVEFVPEGGVKFTSYINNLHPTRHARVYETIEKLIETVLPAWDACLAQSSDYDRDDIISPGRSEPRFPYPENPE